MRVGSLLLSVAVLGASFVAAVGAAPPTNVILIAADDLGYGELGCYGQKRIRTPRIDELARQGTRLTQFYSGNAVCAPSRCCLMTGKHPGHAFVRNNGKAKPSQEICDELGIEFSGQTPLPAAEVTLAEMLQDAGYATGAFGKWGLGHFTTSGDPNSQGFDLFYGFNCQWHAHNHYPNFLWRNRSKEIQPGNDRTLYGQTYSQDQFVDEACQFIRANADRPFFAYVPFAVPHLSIQVPDEALSQYDDVIVEESYKHRGYLPHPRPRAGYAAMVTHMDEGVGTIMDLVDELGLTQQTLILFTSDNGPTYDRLGGSDSEYFDSAAGLKGLKGQLDEGGIRVPMIARMPGTVKEGMTSDWIGAWWDILPTIADICQTAAPAGIDGLSFAPLLKRENKQQPQHEALYWEFGGYTGQQAVRMGRWKAIRKGLAKKNPESIPAWQLYDLDVDRSEQRDVAGEHHDVVARIDAFAKGEHVRSERFPLPALD
ncbi:MAG: arylsulfatase [Planctomycetota bacterium]